MTTQKSGDIAESRKWFTHFSLRSMTALHVSSFPALQLTESERCMLTPSIQQFQLGEGSPGQRLLERGQRYGRAANDSLFAGALDLFIKEEQQHSRYLAAFMESEGIPLLRRHWLDSTFRVLRGLAGLELALAVLVTAEIISVPYYRALRGATSSSVLKMICTRILDDEASHLKFQASMVARVAGKPGRAVRRSVTELHKLLLIGTMLVVWKGHRGVFEAGGYSFRRFAQETLSEFSDWSLARWACAASGSGRREMALSKAGQTGRQL